MKAKVPKMYYVTWPLLTANTQLILSLTDPGSGCSIHINLLVLPTLGPLYLLFPLPRILCFPLSPLLLTKLVYLFACFLVVVLFLIYLRASLKIHLLWEVATLTKITTLPAAPTLPYHTHAHTHTFFPFHGFFSCHAI